MLSLQAASSEKGSFEQESASLRLVSRHCCSDRRARRQRSGNRAPGHRRHERPRQSARPCVRPRGRPLRGRSGTRWPRTAVRDDPRRAAVRRRERCRLTALARSPGTNCGRPSVIRAGERRRRDGAARHLAARARERLRGDRARRESGLPSGPRAGVRAARPTEAERNLELERGHLVLRGRAQSRSEPGAGQQSLRCPRRAGRPRRRRRRGQRPPARGLERRDLDPRRLPVAAARAADRRRADFGRGRA